MQHIAVSGRVMDAFSFCTEGAENDPNWLALEALKNESTLEERAENFKVQHGECQCMGAGGKVALSKQQS